MKLISLYIISVLLFAYLVFIFFYTDKKMKEVICTNVNITVMSEEENNFVEVGDIQSLVYAFDADITKRSLLDIETDSVEKYIKKSSMVKSCDVYYNIYGNLNIQVAAREPILRIVGNPGYYLDSDGMIMPLSQKATKRTLVASGSIARDFATTKLFPFVQTIYDNDFWTAYIEQIDVKSEEITLIPKVGNFKIEFGELENIEEKFEHLLLFLESGINKRGWNYYHTISVKYKNQIVGKKRIF